jgi:hypothetical protein
MDDDDLTAFEAELDAYVRERCWEADGRRQQFRDRLRARAVELGRPCFEWEPAEVTDAVEGARALLDDGDPL